VTQLLTSPVTWEQEQNVIEEIIVTARAFNAGLNAPVRTDCPACGGGNTVALEGDGESVLIQCKRCRYLYPLQEECAECGCPQPPLILELSGVAE
jgi:uncharacterized OB-fold protein